MAEKRRKRLVRLGEQVELLHMFERDFLPYVLTLGKICVLIRSIPILNRYVSKDELQHILVIKDFFRKCRELKNQKAD
jgi:hypothetical protein